MIRGPDKGKMGRVIWLYDQLTATVKLEPNPLLGGSDIRSFREARRLLRHRNEHIPRLRRAS